MSFHFSIKQISDLCVINILIHFAVEREQIVHDQMQAVMGLLCLLLLGYFVCCYGTTLFAAMGLLCLLIWDYFVCCYGTTLFADMGLLCLLIWDYFVW